MSDSFDDKISSLYEEIVSVVKAKLPDIKRIESLYDRYIFVTKKLKSAFVCLEYFACLGYDTSDVMEPDSETNIYYVRSKEKKIATINEFQKALFMNDGIPSFDWTMGDDGPEILSAYVKNKNKTGPNEETYNKPMVCIIVAMEKEADTILKSSSITKRRTSGYAKIYEANYQGRDYLLVVSGIGKAFASSAITSALLLYPNIEKIINVGVAGSLDKNEADLFDVIIASSVVEHDMDTSAIGDPKGLVSGINIVDLPTSKGLNEILSQSAKLAGFSPKSGIISSGDTFYADKENKERIKNTFRSVCSDMEGAPIGQIAYVYKKEFAEMRVISDADNAAEEYPQNAKKAADIAASIILKYLSGN